MVTPKRLIALLAVCLGLASPAGQAADDPPERITVGYFEQWPTPSLFSQAKMTYDRALGIPVEWIPYDSGAAMSAAMAAGELQIAFSQGHAPFVLGVSQGLELTLIGIAVVAFGQLIKWFFYIPEMPYLQVWLSLIIYPGIVLTWTE